MIALLATLDSLWLRAGVALARGPAGRFLVPKPRKARAPDEDQAQQLWHWIEDNGEVVFPLIGLLVLGLVAWAVRRGSLSQAADLQLKGQHKDALVRLMRAKLMLTADAAATELRISRFHAATLLDELQREGKLVQNQQAGGIASYRLKGL